jgi:hypothetical protein
VDADGVIEIWISGAKYRRHSSAGGEAGCKYTATIDIMFSNEVCGKSSDNGGFAAPAHLIARIKPIPARGRVG